MFDTVKGNDFPKMEKDILDFWEAGNYFKRSLENRKENDEFIFYDGPPFATGLPHYGHLLAGTIKDVVPRYQTMRGKYVERTFGWDCHGLPIEALAQEALGLAGAPAIKERGVDIFNEQCRSMVLRYVNEWKRTVTRMGRWVDFDNGYKTMDKTFMESIWWVFKQLWNQGRIYKAHRIMPYSWKLNTPLSNFEANRNYQDVQDPSVTIRCKIKNCNLELPANEDAYILVWTTTPWTLPANLAVCAGPDIDYVVVRDTQSSALYIMAQARVDAYYKKEDEYEIVISCKGSDLLGATYEPIFPYFADHANSFTVLNDSFVTTSDGTGIVHMAPAYGEDDYRICRANKIELIDPLNEDASFTNLVPEFAGMHCKEADKSIIRHLKQNGKLIRQSTIVHSYPFCERTDTPLIYRAIDAWYVRVEDMREDLLNNNSQINWTPNYVGEKRFANWLANAKDWNISRNRFWGSCLPVWVSEDGEDMICVESAAELEKLSGQKVDDLHKHFIDKITIEKDGKTYHRTPEVLDCWFESGSMPYAQSHYPFNNKEKFEANFPAHFIAEGLDQTRGWFYTLNVLSTALFNKPAFQNVVVNGLVLAEDGRKMSKRLKNYPDPEIVMNKYGADALRLCLLNSPVVRAEDLRFSEDGVRESMRTVILPLWNAYKFLVTYARVDNWTPTADGSLKQQPKHVLDRWILSRLQQAIIDIQKNMDNFDLQRSALRFTGLITELTNWYIRRSRRRFWKSQNDNDKYDAYATLYHVLLNFCKLAAPFIPFVTEEIFQNLRTEQMPESIHLCNFPTRDSKALDEELSRCMAHTMTAVSLGRYLRTQSSLRVRQPLQEAIIVAADPQVRNDLQSMTDIIAEELNVKNILIRQDEEELVNLSVKANFKSLGAKLGKNMRTVAGKIAQLPIESIRTLRNGGKINIAITDSKSIDISLADVVVHRQEKEGMSVANEGEVTIALNTRLTDELICEGWSREIVSFLQNLRKESNLQVTDRITVSYHLPEVAENAMQKYAEYIKSETLADQFIKVALDTEKQTTINEQTCSFSIKKV